MFGITDFSTTFQNIWNGSGGAAGTGFDFSSFGVLQWIMLILLVIIFGWIFSSEKSSQASQYRYTSSDVMLKAIDKDADLWEIVEKSTGRQLTKGTKQEVQQWKTQNVEPRRMNPNLSR